MIILAHYRSIKLHVLWLFSLTIAQLSITCTLFVLADCRSITWIPDMYFDHSRWPTFILIILAPYIRYIDVVRYLSITLFILANYMYRSFINCILVYFDHSRWLRTCIVHILLLSIIIPGVSSRIINYFEHSCWPSFIYLLLWSFSLTTCTVYSLIIILWSRDFDHSRWLSLIYHLLWSCTIIILARDSCWLTNMTTFPCLIASPRDSIESNGVLRVKLTILKLHVYMM